MRFELSLAQLGGANWPPESLGSWGLVFSKYPLYILKFAVAPNAGTVLRYNMYKCHTDSLTVIDFAALEKKRKRGKKTTCPFLAN